MMISRKFPLTQTAKIRLHHKCVMNSTNVSATFHESCDAKTPHLRAISNENTGAPNGKAIEPRHGVCGA
jgi:hypothetical protein